MYDPDTVCWVGHGCCKAEPLYDLLPERTNDYPSAIDFKENLEIVKKTGSLKNSHLFYSK